MMPSHDCCDENGACSKRCEEPELKARMDADWEKYYADKAAYNATLAPTEWDFAAWLAKRLDKEARAA